MTDAEALTIAIERTGNQRLRELVKNSPGHLATVRILARADATDPTSPHPSYPGLLRQAALAGQAGTRWIASGLKITTQEEHDRRRGVCADCEHLDAGQNRCRKCGCYLALKPWAGSEHCPVQKW